MKLSESVWTRALITLGVLLVGCAEVKPWERGNLAKPQMAIEPYPMQSSLRSHNYGSREAASASSGASQGGGCGCY